MRFFEGMILGAEMTPNSDPDLAQKSPWCEHFQRQRAEVTFV